MSFSRFFFFKISNRYAVFFQRVTKSSYRISYKNQLAFSKPTTWFSATSFFKKTYISFCRGQLDFLKEDHELLVQKVFVFFFQMATRSCYKVSHRRSQSIFRTDHLFFFQKNTKTSRKSPKKTPYIDDSFIFKQKYRGIFFISDSYITRTISGLRFSSMRQLSGLPKEFYIETSRPPHNEPPCLLSKIPCLLEKFFLQYRRNFLKKIASSSYRPFIIEA